MKSNLTEAEAQTLAGAREYLMMRASRAKKEGISKEGWEGWCLGTAFADLLSPQEIKAIAEVTWTWNDD